MNVRSASFRDLGRIEQLFRDTAAHEERQVVRPPGADSPVPQAALVRLWYALTKTLSPLVPMSDSGTSLLVADDADGALLGFIQAQGVSGQPKAWHVTHLCTQPTARGHFAGAPLITSLMHQGMEHGVTRFVVSVPVGSPLLGLFVEQGYTQYATEQILFRDDTEHSPHLVPLEDVPSNLRPARREDLGQIHLLYLRTTPSTVANVEGPTLKAWQSSYAQGWMTRMGRDDVRHFVLARAGVVAWAALRPASAVRPGLLALTCDGQDAQLRDEFVDAVLAQAQPGPLTCILRHYDSELIRALQSRGFAVFSTQLLLVRDLAIKVRVREVAARKEKKGVLVPAGLARAVPPHAPASGLRALNVAVNIVERSRPSSSLR